MGSILGGALDIVGNAGSAIMTGLNEAQQTILSIPQRIVQTGQELGTELGYQTGTGTAGPVTTQPAPQQPEQDNTVLFIAGGIGILLVVILLTR